MFDIELFDAKTLWLVPRWFDPGQQSLFEGMPERKWRVVNGKKGWAVPATRINIEYIYKYFAENVDFTLDQNAKLLISYERLTNKVDTIKASKRWDYLFNGNDTEFNYPSPVTPFMHQRVTVEACFGAEYFGLLMDMGTGKTKCIADEIELHALGLQDKEMFRFVIVCPKSLIMNWHRELHAHIPDLVDMRVECMNKGDAKSVDIMVEVCNDPARVKGLIISYDSLPTQLLTIQAFHPHYLACDESHFVKNASTKRWKALRELAELCDMRRILTGTVTCNNILDVWAQFEILRPGALGYQTYQAFKATYAEIMMVANSNGQDFEKITGFRGVEQLKENMAKMSFTVKKEQCLDLPPKLFTTVEVEMTPELKDYYEKMLDEMQISLGEGKEVVVKFALVQLLKLSQLCCGFIVGKEYFGEMLVDEETGLEYQEANSVTCQVPGNNPKLDQMIDDAVVACEEGKLIIWNRFKLSGKQIEEALLARGIPCGRYDSSTSTDDRQRIVDAFNNDPAFKVFIGNPGAGGTGLTLLGSEHCRTKNVFYYSNDFSYSKRIQSEDRCHRIGLKNEISYRDYVYAGSVEKYILGILKDKQDIASVIKNVASLKDILLDVK